MNKLLAALLLLLAGAQDAKDPSVADADGPYVFEAESGWVAKRIVRAGPRLEVRRDMVEEWKPVIEVPLPGRDKPLSVTLRGTPAPPASSVPVPAKILALSDIEGNLDALIRLLRAGGAIDQDLRWTFGSGHVVYVGDLFDRGLQVTECLWLLYELEARAASAGGALHFILGNHEVMNLTGDFRYVRKKYRENAKLLEEKLEDLYSRRSALGRWLRTRNAVLRIGDEIFVHGGISPEVAESKVPLQELNDALRKGLAAETWTKPKEGPLRLAVDSKEGLIWYRGYLKDPIDEKAMDAILAEVEARRVVVGHTIVREVGFVLGGRVLALDVRQGEGVNQAALLEKGEWHRLHSDGRKEKLASRP
ncbi:MAG TPA: metallophosphoesterase [Candidatus Eisenbacteria bacterium]|nr:metallophosphoesterase [Candidatus Eisenbacteria bacterium]